MWSVAPKTATAGFVLSLIFVKASVASRQFLVDLHGIPKTQPSNPVRPPPSPTPAPAHLGMGGWKPGAKGAGRRFSIASRIVSDVVVE